MSILSSQLERKLLPGMSIPDPLFKLFDWIEQRGYFVDNEAGRVGSLFSNALINAGWTDTERQGGTLIEFMAEGNKAMRHWFGHDRRDVIDRLCVFAYTGSEGSMAALWLDDSGTQRIVHMGSGSGSILCCVLADDPIDFLRLIAIGYDELCWNEQFSAAPNTLSDRVVYPNLEYQAWVRDTFNVSIPETALEIVKNPAEMSDKNSPDDFCRWVENSVEY